MRKWMVMGALAGSVALASCANMSPEDRAAMGTVVGGVVGGVVGSQVGGDTSAQIVGGVVGSLIGAYIGNQIAQYVNEQEAEEIAAQQRYALAQAPARESKSAWTSKDKKKKATVVAKPKTTKKQAVAAAAPASGGKGKSKLKNLSSDFDDLPESTACRESTTTLQADGQTVQDTGLYCQDEGGDYVRVADLDRA